MQKLLFDATMLTKYKKKNGERSGIFFTAYNILKNLQKRSEFEIYLYGMPENLLEIENVKKDLFPDLKLFQKISLRQRKILSFYRTLDMAWETYINRPFIRKPISFFILLYTFFIRLTISPKTGDLDHVHIFFSSFDPVPPVIKKVKSIRKFVLLHDIIPLILPQYQYTYQMKKLVNSLSLDEFYFCNSIYTQQDFQKICKRIKKENSEHLYLAASERFRRILDKEKEERILEKYHIPLKKKFLFSLCTLEPRKNLLRIIKTFINFLDKNHIDDCCFILGGGQWVSFWNQLKKEIPNFDRYSDRIIHVGYIDDEDLPVIYSNAEWFVYTSQYEGFGLPPLEAMQCGCPVITSNNSSLPEVVGDAGIMIDWDSDEQHIQAYEKYYFDENLRETNRQKGLDRAKLFSWEKTVDKMIEVMERK